MLARYFAGYHAADVVGLVLIDPSPMVTESLADNLTPFEGIGAGRKGFDAYWSAFSALVSQAAPAVRAEDQVIRQLLEADLSGRDLPPMPRIPIAAIIAGKCSPIPLAVPFDLQRFCEADVRYRLRVLGDWTLASPHGSVLMSNDAAHNIPRDDPGQVVAAVQRVVNAPR
jgi:pimeloyl-ACP methyl ester carboxylesterase